MGIFTWLVVGGIAGWLAGTLIRGGGFGLLGNVIIGIIGALFGGWLAGVVFDVQNAITGFNIKTILVATLGAAVLLFVARLLR